nr:MAG TPA: hypothetical protein [Caudoviricetes sp.]
MDYYCLVRITEIKRKKSKNDMKQTANPLPLH